MVYVLIEEILQIDFISRKLIVVKYNHLTHIQNQYVFVRITSVRCMVASQPVCLSLDQVPDVKPWPGSLCYVLGENTYMYW